MCSKLTLEGRHFLRCGNLIVYFEQVSQLFCSVSIAKFEQVIVC